MFIVVQLGIEEASFAENVRVKFNVLADEGANKEVAVLVAFLPSVVQIYARFLASFHKVVRNQVTHPWVN